MLIWCAIAIAGSWSKEFCVKHAGILFTAGVLLMFVVVSAWPSSAGAALKPPQCDKELTKSRLSIDCELSPAGPFVVIGHSTAGYEFSWSVLCFDQNANGLAAGGRRTVNGNFTLSINRKAAPRAYKLMAEAVHCGVDITFRAYNPGKPHKVRGSIKWTHYAAPTLFHD